MGETTAETPNGVVSTDPATRAYIKDNARLNATTPAAGTPTYGSSASGNIEPDNVAPQTKATANDKTRVVGRTSNKLNTTGGMTSNGTNP